MNRRQFLAAIPFVPLITACSQGPEQGTAEPSGPLSSESDNYQRELSRQVYPKIRNLKVPLDSEVLSFNPDTGQFERRVIKRVFLRPTLSSDGMLVWSPKA